MVGWRVRPTKECTAQANPRDWFQGKAPPRFEPRPFSKWHPSPSRKTGWSTCDLDRNVLPLKHAVRQDTPVVQLTEMGWGGRVGELLL